MQIRCQRVGKAPRKARANAFNKLTANRKSSGVPLQNADQDEIGIWLKKDGDYVERDEVIAELESEKATFEVNAEKAGVLKTVGKEGDTLNIGDTLAQIDESAAKPEASKMPTTHPVSTARNPFQAS